MSDRLFWWIPMVAACLTVGLAPPTRGQDVPRPEDTLYPGTSIFEQTLPPVAPWDGASRRLALSPGDPWATPCEKSGLTETPRYDETVAWLRKLAGASPEVEMVSLGTSPEGRTIWMVVASADHAFTPDAIRESGKPTLYVQAGIHAGEIDGKDAGMMLLRDLTVRGNLAALLRRANLLFVPILNVDGHERFSPYGRINQRGPKEMGWRTNARNLNLNRDYAKLDTPEVRAVVAMLNAWDPDLTVGVHVTDGIDCQYDVTWGYNGPHAYSPNAAAWLDATLTPAETHDLTAMGHVPGPFFFIVNRNDLMRGVVAWTSTPRYSDGYGDVRHNPAVLVETHSLKPYDRRVLGTYVFLETALRVLGENAKTLKRATEADRTLHRREIPLGWGRAEGTPPTRTFLGIAMKRELSPVSGGLRTVWTGEPDTLTVPVIRFTRPAATVARPKAWWVPATYPEVIERLRLHGIRMDSLSTPKEVEVTEYRITEPKLDQEPFEGHVRVSGTPVPERHTERYPAGSVRIPADQPLGDLAAVLLEPGSGDSFFQWGFFLAILERTEYAEPYVMEPLASRMLAEDPQLARAFKDTLAADPAFAGNPRARLRWFYDKTPYADARWRLYPVGREE
jgi:murein tripeptide amidase MpaA